MFKSRDSTSISPSRHWSSPTFHRNTAPFDENERSVTNFVCVSWYHFLSQLQNRQLWNWLLTSRNCMAHSTCSINVPKIVNNNTFNLYEMSLRRVRRIWPWHHILIFFCCCWLILFFSPIWCTNNSTHTENIFMKSTLRNAI